MESKEEKRPIAIKDVLADKNHPMHEEVSSLINDLDTGKISLCACMGKIGDDPYCPCEMRSRGLEPTNVWTPEAIAEFERALLPYCN